MTTDRRVHGCGVEILAGRTTLGFDIEVEVAPLDADGELAAALAGIPSYTWYLGADVLASRSPFQIATAPAGTRPRVTVHAAHRCPERTTRP